MPHPMPLDMALRLAAAGYHIAPVTIRRDPATGKKRPDYHGLSWDAAATTDPDQLVTWARQYGPDLGFLVATEASGLCCIDLDLTGDGLGWWAREALPCSPMIVDTPSGGQHHYWRMPAGAAIPNSAGAIATGVDVRGIGGHLYAPGTRVLGDPEPYRLIDTLVGPDELPEMPDEIVKRIPVGRRKPRDRGPGSSSAITHDETGVIAECARALTKVGTYPPQPGAGFRNALMGAAMTLGRAVSAGLAPRDYAEQRLAEETARCWGRVDGDDQEWIATGLDDGEADPWTVIPAPDPAVAASCDVPDAAHDPDGYALALTLEVRKLRLRREAAALIAAENRDPLVVLRGAAFLDAPMPDYLVPKMLYRDGLAVVFGAPGAAKSFLVLDLALSLATGTPWRGRSLGHGRVHYVMAEGQATNTLRTRAWLHHHEVATDALDGTWTAVPVAVLLTEAGIVDYLEIVRADQPDMIVLDTKNLMFAGKESQGDDYGAMLRVLHTLRQAAGGAAVVLIDHTGLGDETRVRGSNAQKGGVETEIRVAEDEHGIRRVEVTRDKSGATGTTWAFRLHQIPEVPRPIDVDPPAVCVPADDDPAATGRVLRASCWDMPRGDLPDTVTDIGGSDGDAAGDIFRALLHVRDVDGMTASQINTLVGESPRRHSRTAVYAAVGKLVVVGVLDAPSPKNFVLAAGFTDWTGRPE